MCAQGIKWNTQEKLAIGANTDADTVIAGYANETIVGIKTETLVGGWGVGVGGLKTEVIAGAQIGIIAGFKGEWTEGYKYDRVPLGQVEIVGDHVGSHGSHWTTVGTSFFMNANTYANIASPILILSATTAAVNSTTKLSLTGTQALLTGGGSPTNLTPASLAITPTGAILTGITAGNLVSISASGLLINHATSAVLGISNGNSVSAESNGVFVNSASGVFLNGSTAGVVANGVVKLGTPSAYIPAYQSLLNAAMTAAKTASDNAQAAAAAADAAAAAAAGTAAAAHP